MSVPSAVGKALSIFRCDVVEAGNAMISLASEAETDAIGNEFYDAMSMAVLSSVPFSSHTILAAPEVTVITGQGAINSYIRIQMGGKKRHKDILEHINTVGTHLAEDFKPGGNADNNPAAGVALVKTATSHVAGFFGEFGTKFADGPAIHVLLLPATFKTENRAALYIYGGDKASGYILVSQEPTNETEETTLDALLTGLAACFCDCAQAYAPECWSEVLNTLRDNMHPLLVDKREIQNVPVVNLFAQCRKKNSKRDIMARLDNTAKIYRPLTLLIKNQSYAPAHA